MRDGNTIDRLPTTGNYVYLLYAVDPSEPAPDPGDGPELVLLYVGSTDNLRRRLGQHAADKWWWSCVNLQYSYYEQHGSRDDAYSAELWYIRSEKPALNIAGRFRREYPIPRGHCPDYFRAPVWEMGCR